MGSAIKDGFGTHFFNAINVQKKNGNQKKERKNVTGKQARTDVYKTIK